MAGLELAPTVGMEKMLYILVSLIVSLSAASSSFAKTTPPDLTLKQVVAAMDPVALSEIPAWATSIGFYDFKVYKNTMSFQLEGLPIFVEVIQSDDVAFKLNGVALSRQDVQDGASLRRAFVHKMKFRPRAFSLLHSLFGTAFATGTFHGGFDDPSFTRTVFSEEAASTSTIIERETTPYTPIVFNKQNFYQPTYKPQNFRALGPLMGFLGGSSIRNVFTSMEFLFSALTTYTNNMGAGKPYLNGDPDPTAIEKPTFSVF